MFKRSAIAPAESPNINGAASAAAVKTPISMMLASSDVIAIRGVAVTAIELDMVLSVSDTRIFFNGVLLTRCRSWAREMFVVQLGRRGKAF